MILYGIGTIPYRSGASMDSGTDTEIFAPIQNIKYGKELHRQYDLSRDRY